MAHLTLSLLGGFAATLDGQPLTTFGADKARALLSYLLVEADRSHRRIALAALFWPESPAKKAAHNLSQTLLRLRRVLRENHTAAIEQPFLLVDSQEIRLNPLSSFYLDVAEFQAHIRAHKGHQHARDDDCLLCIGWLRQAVDLYRGDFLAGFSLSDSIPFEEWQLIQQEALHSQVVSALSMLVAHYERRGEPQQVEYYARRLVALEPWQEQAHLQLLTALAQGGQRGAALEQYASFSRALAEAFDMTPSSQARALYERIRAEDGRIPSTQPTPASAPPTAAGTIAPHGERRQVTALVCGRRNPAVADDPEEQIEQWTRCREQCGPILERYGGQRQPRQGLECLIYFGYPLAQEDAALRAVYAGLELVAAGQPDEMRVGIHTGLMVADDGSLVGDAPDLARACRHLAGPDQVALTTSVERLARGRFVCQAIGQVAPPGTTAALTVYRVAGESGVQTRLEWLAQQQRLTPFVGREAEAAQLVAWLETPVGRQCPVIVLRGEPGIGKSRLAREMRRQGRYDVWLESHCTPYLQNTSLSPLTRLLEQLLGFQADDPPGDKGDKLERTLVRLEMAQPAHSWLLALMLGLPTATPAPQTMTDGLRQQLRGSFLTLLARFTAAQTAVILIEDLQWADPSTLAWLDAAIEIVAATGCRLLLTHRTPFTLPWRPRPQLRHMPLGPLSLPQMAQMVVNLAEDMAAADAGRIITLTDGNPLFVEELTWAVLEAGTQLRRDAIPPTLRDSLLARLDRVGAAKETVGWAAALGREFTYALLTAVVPYDEQRLQTDLAALMAVDLLRSAADAAPPAYAFRHALIQETAYTALLKRTRQSYHRRIAETYAARFPHIAVANPELLAEHYYQAGLVPQAADHWLEAGERAMAQGATEEALAFFERVLALIDPADVGRRWGALSGREAVLALTGERLAQQETIAALFALADANDNPAWRAAALLCRLQLLNATGNYSAMPALADEAMGVARAAAKSELAARALCLKAVALTRLGDPSARRTAEEAAAYGQSAGDEWAIAYATGMLALHTAYTGDYARAVHAWRQVLDLVRRRGDRALESRALSNLGAAYQYLGLFDEAQSCLEEGVALCELIGDRQSRAYNLVNLGGVLLLRGDLAAAQALFEQMLVEAAVVEDASLRAGLQWDLGWLAQLSGDYEQAIQWLTTARQTYLELSMAARAAEATALLGRCALGQGQPAAARQEALQAWRYLEEYGAAAMDETVVTYLSVMMVIAATALETAVPGEPIAQMVAEAGYGLVMTRAEQISDPQWRQTFLENVPANRDMVVCWRQMQQVVAETPKTAEN